MNKETLMQINKAYELQEYILDEYRKIAVKPMNREKVTEEEKIRFKLLKELITFIQY